MQSYLVRYLPSALSPAGPVVAQAIWTKHKAPSRLYSLLVFLAVATTGTPSIAASEGFVEAAPTSGCSTAISSSAVLGLSDVVERVLCDNPQTAQLWAQVRASTFQVGVAQAGYFPQVSASGSNSRSYTQSTQEYGTTQGSLTLGVNYVLYDFGARDAGLEVAHKTLLALEASRQAQLQGLLFDAVQSYYAVLTARENVDAVQTTLAASQYSLEAAQARFLAGTVTKADVLQARTARAQAQLACVQAQGDLRLKQGQLATLMHLPSSRGFELAPVLAVAPSSWEVTSLKELVSSALTLRPDLLAAQYQTDVAKAGVKAAEAQGKPIVSLAASTTPSYSSTYATQPTVSTLAVTLNIPIFTGYQVTYAQKVAAAQLEASAAALKAAQDQADSLIWQAYQALQTNISAVEASEAYLDAAKSFEEVALGRYSAGVGAFVDVLNAQASRSTARQNFIANKYALAVSRYSFSLALGRLPFDFYTATHENKN